MQYFIGKNGQQLGPFGEEQIRLRISSGEFTINDLAWCEGMAAWEPLGRIFSNPYAPSAALGQSPLFQPAAQFRPLAGLGARLGAYLLDLLFFFLAFLPLFAGWMMVDPTVTTTTTSSISTSPVSSGSAAAAAAPGISPLGLGLLGVGGLLALGFMIYQMVLLSSQGQTLGKKCLGIRIVTHQGEQNPGFAKAVLLRSLVPALIGMVPVLGGIFGLVDICFIFREDRRCIHDLMAGTKVVYV